MVIIGGLGSVGQRSSGRLHRRPADRCSTIRICRRFIIPVRSGTTGDRHGRTSGAHDLRRALIVFFLIVEPHGLARLWSIAKSCASGRSPTGSQCRPVVSHCSVSSGCPGRTPSINIARPLPPRSSPPSPARPPPARRAGPNGQFIPGAGLPHRRLRAQRRALGQRLCRLPEAGQCQRRHQRRQDRSKSAETGYAADRGVGVLRTPEGKRGATVFQPLSTGITFALTDKAPADKIR